MTTGKPHYRWESSVDNASSMPDFRGHFQFILASITSFIIWGYFVGSKKIVFLKKSCATTFKTNHEIMKCMQTTSVVTSWFYFHVPIFGILGRNLFATNFSVVSNHAFCYFFLLGSTLALPCWRRKGVHRESILMSLLL